MNDGGTAFPSHEHFIADRENGGERKVITGQPQGGMSLRDYFAAQSMAATISKTPLVDTEGDDAVGAIEISDDDLCDRFARIAASAYAMADAMLKERAK